MDLELEKNLIQRVAVGDMFRRRAIKTPDKIALRDYKGLGQVSYTCKELNQKINCFASAAKESGLGKESRVAILGLNSSEYIIALYGCAKAGITAVPVNPGMAPMNQATIKQGMEIFGAQFMLGTGQTECFPATNVFEASQHLDKSGNYWGLSTVALDTCVMDDNGNILPPGEVGEIVWRGPGVMEGYYKDEEATVESRKFGWHHSGDLGSFDEDGQLLFVDRKKDMIKTGGENVASIKVELAILGDHRVDQVAVVGLPDERWIEAVTAFVIPMKGSQITEQDIIQLCKRELGKFEVPKKVIFMDSLPVTSTGKVRKNILRKTEGKSDN